MTETASHVARKAKEEVKDAAEGAGNYVSRKADQATDALGSGLQSFGSTVRDQMPQSEGTMKQAGNAIADTLQESGRYIHDQGIRGISEDVTNVIRRNPIPAMLIGIGLGFLVAQITTRRAA